VVVVVTTITRRYCPFFQAGVCNFSPVISCNLAPVMTLQHLVNHVEWNIIDSPAPGSYVRIETWLNEALSLSAEEVYTGSRLTDRIGYYYGDPNYRILNGNGFLSWDATEDYSSVYLFFHWLRAHAGEATIYSEIFNSNFSDYQAVIEQLPNYAELSSLYDIDAEKAWDNLFNTWLLATVVQDPVSNFGFKNFNALGDGSVYFARENILGFIDDPFTDPGLVPQNFGGVSFDLAPGDRVIATRSDLLAGTSDYSEVFDLSGIESGYLKVESYDVGAVTKSTIIGKEVISSIEIKAETLDSQAEIAIIYNSNPNTTGNQLSLNFPSLPAVEISPLEDSGYSDFGDRLIPMSFFPGFESMTRGLQMDIGVRVDKLPPLPLEN
jgi:hypothetical protein